MAQIVIPTYFELFNRTYSVNEMSDKVKSSGDQHGYCDYDKAEIEIYLDDDNREFCDHVWFHELTHAILNSIGKHDLSSNEELVDQIGAALHHVFKTARGDLRS